ncbi:hypothetical protein J1N35_045025, partial [Gossypium stocksii]
NITNRVVHLSQSFASLQIVRSLPEMTSSHCDIEKGCVEFEHGLSSFQEKMTSKSDDSAIRVEELLSAVKPPSLEEAFEKMERSSPEMTPSHSEIEECDVKHRLSSSQEESFTISRVPHKLREGNEKAYEPNVISIGPYHYCKPHLVRMEDIKKKGFEKITKKITNLCLNEFREKMRLLEGKTRKCYEQPLPPSLEDEENFVDMMVYDGCFVVQLLQNGHLNDFSEHGPHVIYEMQYDLLLLENQLPFFVLLELYRMIRPNLEPQRHFCELVAFALGFFGRDHHYLPKNTSFRHLLHLVHTTFHPSPLGIQPEVATEENLQSSRNWMPSATELEDAGIRFLGVSFRNMHNEFNITFDNDTKKLKIPTLEVKDSTERELRNYMVHEHYFQVGMPKYFVDYVVFMYKLINTGKDVELLRRSRIIDNCLGNNEAVLEMFEKLADGIYYHPEDFYCKDIVFQVNRHCGIKCNIWKWKAKLKKDYAKLKEEYFNTPWSPLSFIAALVLLLLTILQTIFSLVSYYHQRQ